MRSAHSVRSTFPPRTRRRRRDAKTPRRPEAAEGRDVSPDIISLAGFAPAGGFDDAGEGDVRGRGARGARRRRRPS